jgi:hypothetical protein
MSAKDIIHQAVKSALIKDGWVITHDPFTVQYEKLSVFIDLGAERIIAAERKGEKIAVEIKSFVGRSMVNDLESAIGQYILYLSFLEIIEPERSLYIAVSSAAYNTIFQHKAVQLLIQRNKLPLLVVELETEEVFKWIPS